MKRRIFFLSLAAAIGAAAAYLWPVSKEAPLVPIVDFENGKFGFVNRSGRVVFEPQWSETQAGDPFEMGKPIPVSDGVHEGFVGWDGLLMVALEWDDVQPFTDGGFAPVRRGNKWGTVDREGALQSPLLGDAPLTFDNRGLVPIKENDLNGWANEDGEVVIEPRWDYVGGLDTAGLALVRSGDKFGWINRDEETVIPREWDGAFPFDGSGMALVENEDGWGWIDREGEIVIPCQWEDVGGLARMRSTWKIGFEKRFEISGNAIGSLLTDGFACFDVHGLVPVLSRESGKWGWIDRAGKVVVPPRWSSVRNFDQAGMAPVTFGEGWGWVNLQGEMVVKTEWDDVDNFDSEGMARVSNHLGWGWINRGGETVILPRWNETTSFEPSGLAAVSRSSSGVWGNPGQKTNSENPDGLIGRDGKYVVAFEGSGWSTIIVADHFYAIREIQPTWFDEKIKAINEWFRGPPKTMTPRPSILSAEMQIYSPEGRHIWDSRALRFETKCLITLGFALAIAFFTRPKRRRGMGDGNG